MIQKWTSLQCPRQLCKEHSNFFFLDGVTEAGFLCESAGLQMDSVAGLELNCASDISFDPKGIRQTNLYADIAKLLQFLRSTSSAPALL